MTTDPPAPRVRAIGDGDSRCYRFGDATVDAESMRLRRAGSPIELEPKALLTLLYLVRNPGRLVTKRELLDAVWPGIFVTENSLTHAIAQVRRALDDNARSPRYVETAHALGYRFIAAVTVDEGGRAAQGGRPTRETAAEPSLAVLPFADMSPAGDQEYLCDGVAEELIHALTQLSGLRVAARTSSFAFRRELVSVQEIGRRLGVSAMLEGSVRRHGDRVRVTVQLIDVADGCHLWSERFERGSGDLFALQDEIARGVAERLEVALGPAGGWPHPQLHQPSELAYDLYLQGRHALAQRAPRQLQRAVELFEEAIAADPAWAAPHSGIAEAFEVLGLWSFLAPGEAFGRARAAASRALELDDSLAAAHLSLANVLFLHFWEWGASLRHFELARSACPAEGYSRFVLGMMELAIGEAEEAARQASRHVEAEPASALAHEQAAVMLIALGRIAVATGLLERALELDAGLPMTPFWLGYCRATEGRFDEAAELLGQAAESGLPSAGMYLPAVLASSGRHREARLVVDELERLATQRYTSPVERLFGWAALGERQRCRELFQVAERERCPDFTVSVFAPGFLALAPDWLRSWFDERRRELTTELRRASSSVTPAPLH